MTVYYCVSYRPYISGKESVCIFETALARALFVIGFERFGAVLEEWTA